MYPEYIPNIEEIMSEFHRVLKIGGYVLVTVPFTYPEHLKIVAVVLKDYLSVCIFLYDYHTC